MPIMLAGRTELTIVVALFAAALRGEELIVNAATPITLTSGTYEYTLVEVRAGALLTIEGEHQQLTIN